ncbi:MAG: AtpZ/AtpI family protein [Actinobacteria bacterium]|nr:AtpZ/AtpI family protein [Actinomycetota bacterium]
MQSRSPVKQRITKAFQAGRDFIQSEAGFSDAGLILRIFAGIGVMAGAGFLLDRLLGTEPWFMLAGTVTGAVAVFIDLYIRAGKG